MGNLSKYLYGIMAAAMLAGCSDELPRDDQGSNQTLKDDGNGFFMALDIQMPGGSNGGSRSETIDPDNDGTNSSGGIEIGTDSENNVTSALIVLAAKEGSTNNSSDGVTYEEYGFIAAGTVLSNRISAFVDNGNKYYKATAQLQKDNLENFYNAYDTPDENGRGVYVFVFCNPTADLTALFAGAKEPNDETASEGEISLQPGSANWMDAVCTVIQGNIGSSDRNVGIWGSNSFLMSNVKMETRYLPKNLIEWEAFNAPENPFHLSEAQDEEALATFPGLVSNATTIPETIYENYGGAVKVQRAVARFDFKDGSELGDNTYNVLSVADPNQENTTYPFINVQIEKMCLVNMSKSFYYLLRVSDNGQGIASPNAANQINFMYCAPEAPWTRTDDGKYVKGNYVVGPNYSVFDDYDIINNDFSTYFNYPFFTDSSNDQLVSFDNGNWNVVKVEDVLRGRDDQYEGVDNPKPGETTPYKPGTYKVWRYVTENVIPAPTSNQRNGISTGIVFKAQLKGADIKNLLDNIEEQPWEEGHYQNLVNCLDGKEFTYEGNPRYKITGDSENDPFLDYFDGHLYLGWRHTRQAAIQASVTINVSGEMEINTSTSLYKAVFGDGPIPPTYEFNGETMPSVYVNSEGKEEQIIDPKWPYEVVNGESTDTPTAAFADKNGKLTPEGEANIANYEASADYKWMVWHEGGRTSDTSANSALTIMRKQMTANGITIYQSSNDSDYGPGYYCYYYYWNRHNDNGVPGTMGPMEFAVVRNNVYKLSVDKISHLGHPRIPDNDPENPTPNTPDESQKIYLDVRVQIVPWVVRLNSIVF